MQLFAIFVALFLCAFIQVTTGFGFQILAMPLLTLLLGLDKAAPLVPAVGLLVALTNVVRLHRHVNVGELVRLGLAALAGIPVGFWLQAHVPAHVARTSLGCIIAAYAVYTLLQPQRLRVLHGNWAYPIGIVAGLLGAAYNVPGPPLIVYGGLRQWERNEFRSTLQSFFAFNGIFVVSGHIGLHHYDGSLVRLILLAVPVLLAGNICGAHADRHIDRRRFQQLVKGLMLAMGILLLF